MADCKIEPAVEFWYEGAPKFVTVTTLTTGDKGPR